MTNTAKQIKDTVMNGVNVTRLQETIRAVKADASIADFKFRVKNQWDDGARNKATITDFYGTNQNIDHRQPFEIECGEPEVLLGNDDGANPVEVLLAALSGCMTTSLAYHAAAQGFCITDISSEYEGDIDLRGFLGIDERIEKGYREIRVKLKVKGDVPAAKAEDLVKRSPVYDTLTRPVCIKVDVVKM